MRAERACERDPGLRGFEGKPERGEQLQRRLEVRLRAVVSSSRSDVCATSLATARVRSSWRSTARTSSWASVSSAAARPPRASRTSTSKASTGAQSGSDGGARSRHKRPRVAGQSEIAASQRDPRERPLGARVPVKAIQQTFGPLVPSLTNAEVREPKQCEELGRREARLEGPNRGEQLVLRLFLATERDENPAIVRPAGRRHEVAPRLEASRGGEPLLGASDVGRPFTRAQHPAGRSRRRGQYRRSLPRRPRPSLGRAA